MPFERTPPDYSEQWLPVPGMAGLLASSWGRLLLPPPTIVMPRNGATYVRQTKPTWGVLKRSRKGGSYQFLGLRTAAYGNIKVHIAVASAFHGPRPFPEALVLHEDEDGTNNVPLNLRWGTHAENMNYPRYREAVRIRMLGNTNKAGVKLRA